MFRSAFVTVLLVVGFALAIRGPLEALLLYLWIAYFRPEQWVWTDFFQTLNLSYYAGLLLVVRALFSGTSFRFDLRTGLLLAILVQSALSTLNSEHAAYSQPYLRDFAKSLMVAYLIAVLASSVSRMRLVVLVIGLSLAFEAAKQGWAQLFLNPGGTNINEVPFLGDNNGVAVGMLMLVSLLVALARTAATKKERLLHRLLAVGVLYRAISTYSRGGFLAAAVLGVVFLARSPHKLRALMGAALAATIIFSVLPAEYWERMNTITVRTDEDRDVSAGGRLHFWAVAIAMAGDRPLVGVGHNAYNLAYDQYDFSDGAYGARKSVHSAWFGVVAELGLPGFILFLSNLLLAWLACRRARSLAARGHISKDLGHFATGIEGALAVFAVGGAFVIFQYTEMLWHVIGLSIAVHFATERELTQALTLPPTVPGPVPSLSRPGVSKGAGGR